VPDYVYRIFDPKTDDIYPIVDIGATVKEIGEGSGPGVTTAINFNFANDDDGIPIGRVIVDGKQVIGDIPKTKKRDELYMLPDRTLHIGKAPAGALWAVQGSPPLLEDGVIVINEGVIRDKTPDDISKGDKLRTAVGITEGGKLVMVRTYAEMTLQRLAGIMKALGCVHALNGDGGGSSYIWPNDVGQYGRKLGLALIGKRGKVKPVTKPVLIIDPGHGGSDPGADGNGMIEKEWTLRISLYQFERFKALGVPVALTRSTDFTLGEEVRTKTVRDSGAKYCISNHLNAANSTDDSASGVESIHSIHSDGKLAHALVAAIRDAGQKTRKTPVFTKQGKSGNDFYYMHRLTGNVSTVIVEYGFMTNAADAARIKANWKAYAEAVIRAFCAFAGFAYSAPEQEPEAPETGARETKSADRIVRRAVRRRPARRQGRFR
jgi:N-acetylmuramoyl-L-alanine amidase